METRFLAPLGRMPSGPMVRLVGQHPRGGACRRLLRTLRAAFCTGYWWMGRQAGALVAGVRAGLRRRAAFGSHLEGGHEQRCSAEMMSRGGVGMATMLSHRETRARTCAMRMAAEPRLAAPLAVRTCLRQGMAASPHHATGRELDHGPAGSTRPSRPGTA